MVIGVDWPEDLAPSTSAFYLKSNSLVNTSPISNTTQSVSRPGSQWLCDFTFDTRDYVKSARIDALLNILDGSTYEVTLFDFRRRVPRGLSKPFPDNPTMSSNTFTDYIGTVETLVLAAGYGAGADAISINGMANNQAALLAGDYIGIGGYIYMVCEDVETNGSGQGGPMVIRPRLRKAQSAGDPVYTNRVRGRFLLADNSQGINRTSIGMVSSYTISFIESLP